MKTCVSIDLKNERSDGLKTKHENKKQKETHKGRLEDEFKIIGKVS